MFQVDQFVKISEVRAIVQEGLAEIHKRILKTDDLAKRTSVDMQGMHTKMKSCIQQADRMSNYKKQIDLLFDKLKDHELKIVETRA